jgi:hypothetical protein
MSHPTACHVTGTHGAFAVTGHAARGQTHR